MSYEAERTAFESRFSTMWASETPICFSNLAFTPPPDAAWVRFSVLPGATSEIGIGNPGHQLHRFMGIVVVGIFVPLNKGEKKARQLADKVVNIFKGADFEGVNTWAPYMSIIGESGGYFQVNVTANFKRDEIT